MPVRRLSIPARLDRIELIGTLVDECAQHAGFDESTNYICRLAVGEACENIILHGYQAEGVGEIEAAVSAQPGKLVIELWDCAPPFDAAKEPECDTWPVEDPPVGGLGLRIIHRAMTEVEYRRREDKNYLKLVKTAP